jgi:hypothetical protein
MALFCHEMVIVLSPYVPPLKQFLRSRKQLLLSRKRHTMPNSSASRGALHVKDDQQ